MGTPPIPCTFTPHQIAHNEKRYGEIPPVRGRREVSPRRFSLLTPSVRVRGRYEVLGLRSTAGTSQTHRLVSLSDLRTNNQHNEFDFTYFMWFCCCCARRLWMVGCGSRF